jgi:hypothetical protein
MVCTEREGKGTALCKASMFSFLRVFHLPLMPLSLPVNRLLPASRALHLGRATLLLLSKSYADVLLFDAVVKTFIPKRRSYDADVPRHNTSISPFSLGLCLESEWEEKGLV